MSYINFESARVKETERREKKLAREAILKKAEAEYKQKQEKDEKARLRGDDRWMLPSVEARLKEESKKNKKKKHKKKKKKAMKKKSSSSDSDDESEEQDDQWVEKVVESPRKAGNDDLMEESNGKINKDETIVTPNKDDDGKKTQILQNKQERDEWMTMPGLFPCVSREKLRQQSGHLSKAEEQRQKDKFMIDTLGQSDRELNPYWKDGGMGLPQEKEHEKERSQTLPLKAVGDQGVDWLRRALKRAKEQAAEQGRSLEEVAAERWGSLAKLEEMIAEAEGKSKDRHRQENCRKEYDRKRLEDRRRDWRREKRGEDESSKNSPLSYRNMDRDNQNRSNLSSRSFQRPRIEDDSLQRRNEKDSFSPNRSFNSQSHLNSRTSFQRPSENTDISEGACTSSQSSREDRSTSLEHYRSTGSTGNWRKKMSENIKPPIISDDKKRSKEIKSSKKTSSSSSSTSGSEEEKEKSAGASSSILTDKEMNDLGAKLVKAEILGNESLAKELKKKLDDARSVRAMKSVGTKNSASLDKEETIILTQTDSRGFVRPLQQTGHAEPVGGRRRKQKTETHTDGKRVRYFADDDKYSLKDLFEREKLSTVEDQNELFSKLATKVKEESDMDDVFVEQVRQKESDGKILARQRDQAIREHKKVDRALDNCKWCFDSKEMLKHLVVAIGNKVYLCLPPYQSLTEGHCLVVPMYHTPCATQLDEDVWSEMQTFRKTLVSMFQQKLDLDVVFFETAMYLRKFPHMVLECVPMPREIGDMAPIYFKKAIMECEMEWSTNKKLVDLRGKDVRRAVPKGLPYFSVDFGLDSGFAHVIEDEKMFPKNFAQEIIGGMLDLDHILWRKPKRENFDVQRRKVLQFSDWWKQFDFTTGKEKFSCSSSDSD